MAEVYAYFPEKPNIGKHADGEKDAPDDFKEYAYKKIAADFALLARQLGESRIVLCGHDWYLALNLYQTW